MFRGCSAVIALVALVVFGGCPNGGAIGEVCGGHDDCASELQCVDRYCAPRCERAPECGDGFACDDRGYCQAAVIEAGEQCKSEVDCAAGLACVINDAEVTTDRRLHAICTSQKTGGPAGDACTSDGDCRNGTCALGRCIDLCRNDRDCATGMICVDVPRVDANGAEFSGCLPERGTLTWSIPLTSPSAEVLLPVPKSARSAALVMSVDDPGQRVGAVSVLTPSGARVYTQPCSPLFGTPCGSNIDALDQYYANRLRHDHGLGQSVLLVADSPTLTLEGGAYHVEVSSLRPNGSPGNAIPQVTAVVQLEAGVILDLHFFFTDLSDHPCVAQATSSNAPLDARSAKDAASFQNLYMRPLKEVFEAAGLVISDPTYEDVKDNRELDALNVADAGKLLKLGHYATGINIFFVRSLSPIGVPAYGPNPGPAGLGGTQQSGIIISLDTLCYRDWSTLARLTAHEIGRYMGLYHNIELETKQHDTWRDQLDSDDSSNNLMFFSELGGRELSAGQRAVLRRSGVLR